jgi:SAM-dependent methyltransferase
VGLQEELDAQLGLLQDGLLEIAKAQPAETVVDVGCGCGASSLALARCVGDVGSVTGVDISGPMLAHARLRAEADGLNQLRFLQGDAQVHPFEEASVDLVTSRFGIMFFENFESAFRNLHRALKPGGRIAFMCWRPALENPWMTIPLMAAGQFVELPAPPDNPQAPGPFALSDSEFVKPMMAAAGFSNVELNPLDLKLRVGAGNTIEDAYDFNLKIGPLTPLLADKDEETRRKVRNAIMDALKPHHTNEGVMLDFAAWVVTAKK